MTVVKGQRAYVLHSRPYRETSLVIDCFSLDHGRVSLIARGARRPRSALRGLLLAFQPLLIDWSGSNIPMIVAAEWQGGLPPPSGAALFCAYYANELLLRLLPAQDAHTRLFAAYERLLSDLTAEGCAAVDRSAELETALRRFEQALLADIGYGLDLQHDRFGVAIDVGQLYEVASEQGGLQLATAEQSTKGSAGSERLVVHGSTLSALAGGGELDRRGRSEAKNLMRTLLYQHLADRPLLTRHILRALRHSVPATSDDY